MYGPINGNTPALRSSANSVNVPQCTQSSGPLVVRFTLEPAGMFVNEPTSRPACAGQGPSCSARPRPSAMRAVLPRNGKIRFNSINWNSNRPSSCLNAQEKQLEAHQALRAERRSQIVLVLVLVLVLDLLWPFEDEEERSSEVVRRS